MQVKVIKKPNSDDVWQLQVAGVSFVDDKIILNIGLLKWANETDMVNHERHEQYINIELEGTTLNVDAWRTAIINAIKNRFPGFSDFYEAEVTIP